MKIRQILFPAVFVFSLSCTRTYAQAAHYKDGAFIGDPAEILWGTVQVRAVIQGGKITDVQFLQMPFDRQRSVEITELAKPILKTEAIKSQNAQVDVVTSATLTSFGFRESFGSALAKARQ
jgi:uncharacterized protein with FMN-binding domain